MAGKAAGKRKRPLTSLDLAEGVGIAGEEGTAMDLKMLAIPAPLPSRFRGRGGTRVDLPPRKQVQDLPGGGNGLASRGKKHINLGGTLGGAAGPSPATPPPDSHLGKKLYEGGGDAEGMVSDSSLSSLCRMEGCKKSRALDSNGWCTKHYNERCIVEGCNKWRQRKSLDMCRTHYGERKKKGIKVNSPRSSGAVRGRPRNEAKPTTGSSGGHIGTGRPRRKGNAPSLPLVKEKLSRGKNQRQDALFCDSSSSSDDDEGQVVQGSPIMKRCTKPQNKKILALLTSLPSEFESNASPPVPPSADDCSLRRGCGISGDAIPRMDGILVPYKHLVSMDPRRNFNVIRLAVRARFCAKRYESALKLCQDTLLEWYDDAENITCWKPTNCDDQNKRRLAMKGICDSLSGLWCVYADLLLELEAIHQIEHLQKELDCPNKNKKKPKNSGTCNRMSTRTLAYDGDDSPTNGNRIEIPFPDNKHGKDTTNTFPPLHLSPSEIDIDTKSYHFEREEEDALVALKRATSCPLASRSAWPWLARARLVVRRALAAADKGREAEFSADKVGDDYHGYPDRQRALDGLSRSYHDAILICRDGIDKLTLRTTSRVLDESAVKYQSFADEIALDVDSNGVKLLCHEINQFCKLKDKVGKAEHGINGKKSMEIRNGIRCENVSFAASENTCTSLQQGAGVAGAGYYPFHSKNSDPRLVELAREYIMKHESSAQRKSPSSEDRRASRLIGLPEWGCTKCTALFGTSGEMILHREGCSNSHRSRPTANASLLQLANLGENRAREEVTVNHCAPCEPVYRSDEEASDVLDYLVELFTVTESHLTSHKGDIAASTMKDPGKPDATGSNSSSKSSSGTVSNTSFSTSNTPSFEGQVGLRCIHCRTINSSKAAPGAMIYPNSCQELYRAMWRMRITHFELCSHLPHNVRSRYEAMRNSLSADSGASQRYWDEVVSDVGLQDSDDGRGIRWLDIKKVRKRITADVGGHRKTAAEAERDSEIRRKVESPEQPYCLV